MLKQKMVFVTAAAMVLLMAVLAACGGGGNVAAVEPAEPATGAASASAPAQGEAPAEPATPAELTIQHNLGETVVPVNPEKVVVFDFGALDTLDKLGVKVTGVPQANVPPYLSKYEDAAYENVGSLKEPDFEKIASIDPDLIIISGRQSGAYEELSKLGPTIFVGVDTANYMESFESNAKTLGQIFQKEAEVEETLASIEEQIAAVKEKAASAGKGLVVLVNEGSVSAYGPASRFGMIHDVLGVEASDTNIEVSTHGMSVSFEYIVEQDPDHLFVIDRGAVVAEGTSSSKETVENELVQKTKAYKNGNITYLDPNYWYLSGGGLVSVEEMVKEVAAALE